MSNGGVSPFAKKKLDDGWAGNNNKLIIALESVAKQKDFSNLGIALVNLTGSKRAFAGHNPLKQFRVGSLVKIGVLYAAYQLRFAANDSPLTANTTLTKEKLFKELNASWKKEIDSPVGGYKLATLNYPSLADIFNAKIDAGRWKLEFTSTNNGSSSTTPAEHKQLDDLHEKVGDSIKDPSNPNKTKPNPAKRVALKKLGFLEQLKLMATWSDNTAADLCVEALGLKYILKALEAVGLLHVRCNKHCVASGIWVGSTFVPPEKALSAIPGGEGTLSSNAEHAAKFLTLLHFNELINPESSKDMKAIMRGGGGWFRDALKAHPKGRTKDFYTKNGFSTVSGIISECAFVERQYNSHVGAYIAVVVGTLSEKILERIIVKLDDIIETNP